MKLIKTILFLQLLIAVTHQSMHPKPKTKKSTLNINKNEFESKYWLDMGKEFVQKQIHRTVKNYHAKNVIFFIGDGMSLSTLAGTRMYMGGEEKTLSFENFPYTGLAKTYCLDRIVPDSACTSTAYLTGVKTNYGTIGVNGEAKRRNCNDAINRTKYTTSIGQWALESQKSVGFVTTTRVTHASPAGLYAHTSDRDFENDSDVKKYCGVEYRIPDIAEQLITGSVGRKLKVILGGGRQEFLPIEIKDEENNRGLRTDSRNLLNLWHDIGEMNKELRRYVYNKEQLNKINVKETDNLLGLFTPDHMLYHLEDDNHTLPTLAEMTQKAIELLQNGNDNGYFLFVEGGKIDIAHHNVYAKMAFDETVEFSKAIEVAKSLTNDDDTLIVVSSDHSHTMSISGYPVRHNDIFDVADNSDIDNDPYLTLNYANGKAFKKYFNAKTNKRIDVNKIDRSGIRAQFPSTVPIGTETHGGEDVAVFASGPYSHLFTGVYEQNLLPHLMAYASCIGNGETACK